MRCRMPLGQRISIRSILVSDPRPKWARRSLDDMKPSIKGVGDAWTNTTGKRDEIGKGCDSISSTVQGDDLGLDSKDPAQVKKQKAAKAVLTNALTAIKGTAFKNKQDNVNWVMKQVQAVLK